MQEYWINVYTNNPMQTSWEYYEKHPQWLGLAYDSRAKLNLIDVWSGVRPIYRIHVKLKPKKVENNLNVRLTPIFKYCKLFKSKGSKSCDTKSNKFHSITECFGVSILVANSFAFIPTSLKLKLNASVL